MLKVRAGSSGKVTLKASKRVRKSSKRLKRKGAVWLKVRARGKAKRQLKRRGKVRVMVRVAFAPRTGCQGTTKTRRLKLVRAQPRRR